MSEFENHSTGPPRFSYRARLVLAFVGLTALTGICVLAVSFAQSRSSTRQLADELFRRASEQAVVRTQAHLAGPVPLLHSLAIMGPRHMALDDPEQLAMQLVALLRVNPGLTWLSFSDESGRFTGAHRVDHAVIRINHSAISNGVTAMEEYDLDNTGNRRLFRAVPDSGYDPRTRPFYELARNAGGMIWVPPYLFYDEMVPGVTVATPAYSDTGELLGVFTADFDLNTLSAFVARLTISPHSRFFLIGSDGTLIAHGDSRVVSELAKKGELLKLNEVPDPLMLRFHNALADTPPQVPPLSAGAGATFTPFSLMQDGQPYLASASTFAVGDGLYWTVGALAPESDFLAPARRAQAIAALIAVAAVVLSALVAAGLAQRVSRPVLALVDLTRRVSAGELDAKAQLTGPHEFHELSTSLNTMIGDLRDRLRLRHDMSIAVDVQQRLLPERAPVIKGVEIAGHSTYCDETGGDYYDFIPLGPPHPNCCMVALGDVMGHGIAAALVMAGARAVLRDRAASGSSLADIAARVNHLLCSDLHGSHFMTMHCSIIDPEQRTFRWVSAGHDPAIIYDPAADHFLDVPERGDYPLGILETGGFHEHELGPLPAGVVIVIGTDGIWEANNAQEEQFGKERLCAIIRDGARAGHSAEQFTQEIMHAVSLHRGTLPQHDDLTLVVIRLLPQPAEESSAAQVPEVESSREPAHQP